MNFIEQLRALSVKAQELKEIIRTEEATKNALVIPFFEALGYDFQNLNEVVPEYKSKVRGIKNKERVDYAIFYDGVTTMLVECKILRTNLYNEEHRTQIFRYFSVSQARIAILTNGIEYHFFTDIDEINKMDAEPFMIVDLLNIQECLIDGLLHISKSTFDLSKFLRFARKCKSCDSKLIFQEPIIPITPKCKIVKIGTIHRSSRQSYSENQIKARRPNLKNGIQNLNYMAMADKYVTDGGASQLELLKMNRQIRKVLEASDANETIKGYTITQHFEMFGITLVNIPRKKRNKIMARESIIGSIKGNDGWLYHFPKEKGISCFVGYINTIALYSIELQSVLITIPEIFEILEKREQISKQAFY